jgi:hypothetical protein
LIKQLPKDQYPEAIDPKTGEIDPNRLPESVKANIRDLSSAVATVSGGLTGGSLVNAQIAGVVGQNAVENNELVQRTPESVMQNFEKRKEKIKSEVCTGGMSQAACNKAVVTEIEKNNADFSKILIDLATLVPGISEADALSILLNEKTLSGDETSRIWGAIGIITAGYGQKLRLAGKELLALNSAEELVTSTGHVIKNVEANAIKSESRGVGKEAGKEAAKAEKGAIAKISPENQKYVDILSPEAKQHILYGDSLTSGGHMYPGNPGKTTFPKDWSADKIVHEIGDIATAPNTQWYAQTGTGGIYTAKGKPANWVSYEVRNGVRIRVVYQPATGKIITAFPDNAAIPTSYKPIK